MCLDRLNAPGPLNDAVAGSCRRSFIQGVVTNIGNPKSMGWWFDFFSGGFASWFSE